MRKEVEKLIYKIEPQVVSILIAHGYVRSDEKSFRSMSLTQKGKGLINSGDLLITDEWIKEWKSKWPPNHKGSTKTIRDKLNRFLDEYKCSLKEIEEATDHYLLSRPAPYCGSAMHFFYKKEGRDEVSRCAAVIEELKEETPTEAYDDNIL